MARGAGTQHQISPSDPINNNQQEQQPNQQQQPSTAISVSSLPLLPRDSISISTNANQSIKSINHGHKKKKNK
jgi:hypothetical protein